MRLTTRAPATANHSTSKYNRVFVAAAKAIPAGEDGTERNGPPKTSHQTVTPGCANSRRGSLTTDGMSAPEATDTRAATLARARIPAARSHHTRAGTLIGCRLTIKVSAAPARDGISCHRLHAAVSRPCVSSYRGSCREIVSINTKRARSATHLKRSVTSRLGLA